jgi:hypothetical protein
MRKSERLRLLEMQMVRMEFQVELLLESISSLLEKNKVSPPDLDSGKWYQNKLDDLNGK